MSADNTVCHNSDIRRLPVGAIIIKRFRKYAYEQIRHCWNSLKIKEIIIKLRITLDVLLSDGHPPHGELIEKAISYMNTFWVRLLAYLNDGSYSIYNSIAERFIRPLAGERKNSLFFGSDRMARVSAVYHTIISTCKMQCVSVYWIISKDFSAQLLKDVGITNICYL